MVIQFIYQLVGIEVTTLLWVPEFAGSNAGLVKSDTVSPTARYCCDVSSDFEVMLSRREGAEMAHHSLHASTYCRNYNEDLIR